MNRFTFALNVKDGQLRTAYNPDIDQDKESAAFYKVHGTTPASEVWVLDNKTVKEMSRELRNAGEHARLLELRIAAKGEDYGKFDESLFLSSAIPDLEAKMRVGLVVVLELSQLYPQLRKRKNTLVAVCLSLAANDPDDEADMVTFADEKTDKAMDDIFVHGGSDENYLVDEIKMFALMRIKYKNRFVRYKPKLSRKFGPSFPDGKLHVIRVNWDAPTALQAGAHVHQGGGGWHMPLHGVRGHWRKLQNGKHVWIRPHERGDKNVVRRTITNLIPQGAY